MNFYGSKTPKNLKRIILKRKRAVSEQEIFLEKEKKKIPCTIIIAKSELKRTVRSITSRCSGNVPALLPKKVSSLGGPERAWDRQSLCV